MMRGNLVQICLLLALRVMTNLQKPQLMNSFKNSPEAIPAWSSAKSRSNVLSMSVTLDIIVARS